MRWPERQGVASGIIAEGDIDALGGLSLAGSLDGDAPARRWAMQRWKKLLMAGGGVGAAAIVLPHLRARSLPLPAAHPGRAVPYAGLATSLFEELDQTARVEGRLPAALRGTLYINGPGLFDRGGRRKRNLLDGDGLITAFTLGDGAARLQARFVRTDKLRDEAAAGRYLYATWTTQRPGGLFRNVGASLHPRGPSSRGSSTARPWGRSGTKPWACARERPATPRIPRSIRSPTSGSTSAWSTGPVRASI
jgi:Retinal pigment epithelial membrane protein